MVKVMSHGDGTGEKPNIPGDTIGVEYRMYGSNEVDFVQDQMKKNGQKKWGICKLINTGEGDLPADQKLIQKLIPIIKGEGSKYGIMSRGGKRRIQVNANITLDVQLHYFASVGDNLKLPESEDNPSYPESWRTMELGASPLRQILIKERIVELKHQLKLIPFGSNAKAVDIRDAKAVDILKDETLKAINLEILKATDIARVINDLRKTSSNPEVIRLSEDILRTWEKILPENDDCLIPKDY